MTENMKRFLELMQKDETLIEKTKTLQSDYTDETKKVVMALAEERGIQLTEADFEAPKGELSDDELEVVSGAGGCFCILGGGTKGEKDDSCGCPLVGFGYPTGEEADYRCYCWIGGSGDSSTDD